jgi:ATP-dependent Clp protease protease subunit
MAGKSWYRFENKSGEDATTIYIYDEISYWGISANEFIKDLNNVKTGTINLRVNSPGGDVFDGITIHNALKQHPATVNVQVDGLAASIASIIAMAGDEIRMAKNSFLMIHNAWCFTAGNATELTKMADTLTKVDDSLVSTYQDRTGCTVQDIRTMMAAETWLNADEALAKGFCTAVGDPAEIKAKFDLSKFAHVPQAIAAMNISNGEVTERDQEKRLRDSGFSRQQALTMMAAIKPEQRDSATVDAQKMKEYFQAEQAKGLIKSLMQ